MFTECLKFKELLYKHLRTLEPVKNETEAGVQKGDPQS